MSITTQAYHPSPPDTPPNAGPSNLHPNIYNNIHDEETPPQTAFSILEPPAHLSAITTHTTHIRPLDPDDTFPDGGTRSWLVVLGSFFLLMASYGMMNSTGVLQNYFATHQLANYSTSAVGWIPGLFTFFGLVLSVQIGPMFDRYGPTGILIAGSCCYVAGLLILAECKLYWHFMLTLGVVMGSGAALLSTAAMAAVPQWFDRRVGLAMGWAMSGAGVGGLELEVFAGLGLYPTYVVMQGFSVSTSVILLSILNVFSTIGRLITGVIADKYGRINTQTGLICLGALAIFTIWLPFGHTLPGLYVFSCVFGLASGSFLSLAPALATLICIPIGGEMLEKVGSRAMVAYLGGVLVVALGMFVMARWASLSYRWRWQAKI
ncbi:hypothetical protein PoHVEF18_008267 [Penicillium ochrochloron]